MESLLALFRVAAVKLTSKEESFMVGLIVWTCVRSPPINHRKSRQL